jgi:hypothetical protein
MKYLLALDPGLRHSGLASFDMEGILNAAWSFSRASTSNLKDAVGWFLISAYVTGTLESTHHPTSCRLAYEMPQLIDGWRKGDQNSVLQVAGAAGTTVARMSPWLDLREPMMAVRPSEWTKSRPKKANHLRMWRRLSLFEQERLAHCFEMSANALYDCIRHGDEANIEHALDAVCIGLYALERW